MMNKEEVLVLLSFHSGRNSDIDNPNWKNGWISILMQ